MTPVVLVIQHQELCPPGWVGEWLTEEGLRRLSRIEALFGLEGEAPALRAANA